MNIGNFRYYFSIIKPQHIEQFSGTFLNRHHMCCRFVPWRHHEVSFIWVSWMVKYMQLEGGKRLTPSLDELNVITLEKIDGHQ